MINIKLSYKLQIDEPAYKNTYVPKFKLADIDGDLIDDLIYLRTSRSTGTAFEELYPKGTGYNGDPSAFLVPVKLFLSKSGQLADGSFRLTKNIGGLLPAGVDVGDFNKDGILDFVVGYSGMDTRLIDSGTINHGWHSYIFSSDRSTDTWSQTQLTPAYETRYEYLLTSSVAVGDFNADGYDDIYIGARNWGDRFYFNNQNGKFNETRSFTLFGESDSRTMGAFAIDINLDGNTDLFRLVDNSGDSGFQGNNQWIKEKKGNLENQLIFSPVINSNIYYLPTGLFGVKQTLTTDGLSFKINNDDLPDIIFTQTRGGDQDYLGSQFQILINDGSGGWIDESNRVIDQPMTGMVDYWYHSIVSVDFDLDGDLDIFAYDTDSTSIFENENGFFIKASHKFDNLSPNLNGIYPIDWGDHVEFVVIPGRITSNHSGIIEALVYSTDEVNRRKLSEEEYRAFDLDGNAGNAARALATVFGKDAVKNTTYAGIAISLFDQGMTKDQVSQVAIDAVFGANPKSTDVVKLLWKNLFDADIDASNLAYYSGLIDSKAMTAAQLTTVAADLDLTAQLIDLAGLSKSGWEYVPFGT